MFRIKSSNALWVPKDVHPPDGFFVSLEVTASHSRYSSDAKGSGYVSGTAVCDATTRAPSLTGCEDLEVSCMIDAYPLDPTRYLEPGLWNWNLRNYGATGRFDGELNTFVGEPGLGGSEILDEGTIDIQCGMPLPWVDASFSFDATLNGPNPWASPTNCSGSP